MKKALFLAGAGLLLSACTYQSTLRTVPPAGQTPTAVSPTGAVMTKSITLFEQNKSGESGTAVLEDQAGKLKVTLRLVGGGATNGVAQPAHIHMGKCPTPGVVKYPLTNVVKGESVTILDMTLAQLVAQGDLAINVHKSVQESSFYVSCGDVK